MATSSITHNFVINTKEGVEGVIHALDWADAHYQPPRNPKGKILEKGEEFDRLVGRLKEKYDL